MNSIAKLQLAQNKKGWINSFIEGISQDENGSPIPWMTYSAIEFLKESLKSGFEIFEFGCGASTLFFSQKVKKVTSLETNKRWAEIVENRLSTTNVEIILMPDGLTNENYENFPKNCGKKFDLIIIDSLKRFECAKNCLSALKESGMIILDDSERKNYKKIFEFFTENNFARQDFFGIAPGQLRMKNTSVFRKRGQTT